MSYRIAGAPSGRAVAARAAVTAAGRRRRGGWGVALSGTALQPDAFGGAAVFGGAVPKGSERQCLSREGSGSARQRQCPTHEGSGSTTETQCHSYVHWERSRRSSVAQLTSSSMKLPSAVWTSLRRERAVSLRSPGIPSQLARSVWIHISTPAHANTPGWSCW